MRKLMLYIAIPLLVAVVLFPYRNTLALPASSTLLQSSANDLIAEVNALRVANGLPPYMLNTILMQIAQDQANYMAATGQVAHAGWIRDRDIRGQRPGCPIIGSR